MQYDLVFRKDLLARYETSLYMVNAVGFVITCKSMPILCNTVWITNSESRRLFHK